jgi:hypothetical protein
MLKIAIIREINELVIFRRKRRRNNKDIIAK